MEALVHSRPRRSASRLTFLEDDPGPDRLLRAIVANSRRWITRWARAGGGEVHQQNGVTWVYTPKPEAVGEIAFPRLTEAGAGEQLDIIMAYYRRQRPLKPVICWSVDPPQPRDLAERLVARGFYWHGRTHWMWLDLRRMETNHPRPPGLRIELIEDEGADEHAPAAVVAVTRTRPRRVWRFAASLDGKPVGQSWLHLTTGSLGVAGLYAVHVDPAARNQGVGKAVSLAACQFAQALGCRCAILNATDLGEPVYRRLGFQATGAGQTWWWDPETAAGRGAAARHERG